MQYTSKRDSIELVHLDIMITPKCTLKCRYCSNLMQHYPEDNQTHCETVDIIAGIDTLMGAVSHIGEAFIIGGEPFTHPGLAEGIRAINKNRHKIGYLCVASNGLCGVDGPVIAALRETGTPVRITMYKQFVKEQTKRCAILTAQGVEAGMYHRVWTLTTQCVDGTPETFFRHCHHMVMPCVTLRGSKLYYCEFTANADALGLSCEHMDMRESFTKAGLYDFLNPQEPFAACRYCSGGSSDICVEAAAEQLNDPLPVPWIGGAQ